MSQSRIEMQWPFPARPYMNPRQLAYFHARLLQMRETLCAEIRRTLSALRGRTDTSPGDEADRAEHESEYRLQVLAEARHRRLLAAIDDALARIAQSSFGYCALSGEEIGLARLAANPLARYTLEAQERMERLGRLRCAPAGSI